MKFGVVLPYYNEIELFKITVRAIMMQSYKDWHLFVIDDGSLINNQVFNYCHILAGLSKNITVIYKPNGGVSSARNTALALIYNDPSITHIAYCDADDVWDKNYLENQAKMIESYPSSGLVYSIPRFQFEDGSPAYPYGIASYPEYPGLPKLLEGNFIYISGVVHKVECSGFFDAELNSIEDWDRWVNIAKNGWKFVKNPDTLFTYTCKTNGGNGSRRTSEIYDKFKQKHSKYLSA